MTEEEEKAIENIDKRLTIEKYTKNIATPVYISDLKTILNLIQKQQEEIEKYKIESNNFWEEWNNLEQDSFEEEQKLNAELEKKDKIIDLLLQEKKIYEKKVEETKM